MRIDLALAVASLLVFAACNEAVTPDTSRPEPSPSAPPTASPSGSPRAPSSPNLRGLRVGLRERASGLEGPLAVVHDGSDRVYVVEQVGRIRLLTADGLSGEPFLDITDLTAAGGEQGLLGLAFHPEYRNNRFFYVDYTDNSGDTIIERYEASGPRRAERGSARRVMKIDQPYSNHNGGNLVFGPDGYLYIGTGDGGSAGDPHGNGQQFGTLLGKMLRIDVDRGSPYGIPGDNPLVGRKGARPEIWAWGLRNPWRYSFDRDRGDLWIGDVGQGSEEEIDRVGSRGGFNFGWNRFEGGSCYETSDCSRKGMTFPVTTYGHDSGGCSVTGGYVYRGKRIERLVGAYLFADYCIGDIWAIDPDRPQDRHQIGSGGFQLSSFGEDRRGEIYVTDHGGGRVFQIVPG